MIRIVVVDDQALVRGALAALLDLEDDISVVGTASSGREAVEVVSSDGAVDVVLMDIEMPDMDGLEACGQIRAACPQTRVLIVTTFGRAGYVRRAFTAGASGFVVKDSPAEKLAADVRTVAAGGRAIDQQLAVDSLAVGVNPLTPREREVLLACADGGTIDDIARTLHLAPGTVRNHVSSAIAKTQGRTRAEAARIAMDNGWL